jgi:hypothetical protein
MKFYFTVLSQPHCFWLKRNTETTTLLGKTPTSQHNVRNTQVLCKVDPSKQEMLACGRTEVREGHSWKSWTLARATSALPPRSKGYTFKKDSTFGS